MKFPLSWLTEHVELADDLAADDFSSRVSEGGIEIEEVVIRGDGVTGVRTAKVLERAPHPNADKLQVVQVTGVDGNDQIEVVCGAKNFEVGDIVAHAPPGASLGDFTLEAKELRGVLSNGMLCSLQELGLGDDHDGIAILPADTALGADAADVLGLGDVVIEIKVYADRGDHLSIEGLARDTAAIADAPFTPVAVEPIAAAELTTPRIELSDAHGCPHYQAVQLTGVTDGPSPVWMRQRLEACGMRSLGLVVDITNYVMLEIGQPLHAFDADTLTGDVLGVRRATAGETLTTLDDKDRTLDDTDLVIYDGSGAIALAGVMGGSTTEVTESTSTILLEGAWFDPVSIRTTAHRHGLYSEASKRFARRVDPAATARALARAAQLFVELAGASISGHVTAGAPLQDASSIDFDTARWVPFLGIDDHVDAADAAALLERAGCAVETTGDVLAVTPPSWRGDLRRSADLAEEVVRLYGYTKVPATMPAITTERRGLTAPQRALRDVARTACAHGFSEAVLRPFVGEGALRGFGATDPQEIILPNPLAADAARMRPTMLEGLVTALQRNVGQQADGVALFEVGRIFRHAEDPATAGLDRFGEAWRYATPDGTALPAQPRTVGFVAWGAKTTAAADIGEPWSVWDVSAALDAVAAACGMGPLDREAIERDGWHPGQTVALRARGVEVGVVGTIHPRTAKERDLPEGVAAGELVLEPGLMALATDEPIALAPSLPKHPAMQFDIAILAAASTPWATLHERIEKAVGDRLARALVFDEYTGDGIGDGMRSLGVRLRLQDPVQTLTEQDRTEALAALERELGEVDAKLRR